MLEVYDENGELVLGLHSNLGRVLFVKRRGDGQTNTIVPAEIQNEVKAGRMALAVVSNSFFDLYNSAHLGHSNYFVDKYIANPFEHADICVGVAYYV